MNLDNDAIFVNDKASAGARLGLPKGALWAPKIWKKMTWEAFVMDV